jgi:hypothetical protein
LPAVSVLSSTAGAVAGPGAPTTLRAGRRRLAGVVALAREHWLLTAAIAAGLATRIAFWIATNRQFEDGLITTIHARNAAQGLGLVPHLGEGHVHGFTSPISVLVPLVGELVKTGGGLFALRFVSLIAFAVAAFFVYRLCRMFEVGTWPTAFVLAYLALDRNHLFYGMSGMETQMAVAILLGSMYITLRGRLVWAGVLFGLCMLTRPDFLLWVAIGLGYLAYVHRRRVWLPAVVAFAVVAPWIVFTTAYYGSPVPHTIRAKSHQFFNPPSLRHPGAYPEWAWQELQQHRSSWLAVAPFLEDGQVLSAPVPRWVIKLIAWTVIALGLLGAWTMRRRRGPPIWPIGLYVVGFTLYLLLVLPATYFQWYYPPYTAAVALFAGIGLTALGRRFALPSKALSVLLAIAFAAPLIWVFPMEVRIQKDIENHVRKQMGLWLHAHVPPGQTVTSESAGYISYYGRVKLYDWPGLTSNASYNAMKKLPQAQDQLLSVVRILKPDWIVFRPSELASFRTTLPALAARYHVVKSFQTRPYPIGKPLPPTAPGAGPGVFELDQWGMKERNIDERFFVLRKRSLGPVQLIPRSARS